MTKDTGRTSVVFRAGSYILETAVVIQTEIEIMASFCYVRLLSKGIKWKFLQN